MSYIIEYVNFIYFLTPLAGAAALVVVFAAEEATGGEEIEGLVAEPAPVV